MQFDPWTQGLVSAMTAIWTKAAGFIPNLFAALVLVLISYILGTALEDGLSGRSLRGG